MAIIDNLQKISDMVWELPSQLQGRYARAGVDHAQSLAALFLIW
jgi:hypothetical protein